MAVVYIYDKLWKMVGFRLNTFRTRRPSENPDAILELFKEPPKPVINQGWWVTVPILPREGY